MACLLGRGLKGEVNPELQRGFNGEEGDAVSVVV